MVVSSCEQLLHLHKYTWITHSASPPSPHLKIYQIKNQHQSRFWGQQQPRNNLNRHTHHSNCKLYSLNNQCTIQLIVGHLTLHPPAQQHLRLPRLDDPIPRNPPITFRRDLKITGNQALVGTSSTTSSTSQQLKPVSSESVICAAKRQKLMRVGSVSDFRSGVRLSGGCRSGGRTRSSSRKWRSIIMGSQHIRPNQ